MKKLSMLLFAALFAVAIPPPSAKADVAVSVDFFYDALAPQGDWVYTDHYGYVWQPAVAQQPGWTPYADGYWAYTDAGWTWISNEDFGWATYHYGRWIRMFSSWFWVPGYEWAPAWVSWRQTDDYIGWAPLPPEARWSQNVGFNWWTDSYYDIGPGCYSFVPVRSFATRTSLRPFIVDRRQNVTYIDRSVNITNISFRQNVVNNIFVGGPDPARIDRFGDSRVRRLTLRRDDNDFRRDWIDNHDRNRRGFGSISRIENNQLIVAAPSVRRENSPGLPPRVRERFDKPEIDRGWRNIGDATLAERLRGRQREDLAKARSEKMPEKAPLIVTGKAPPPALGRVLRPEERNLAKRPAPGRVDEEIRKATPQPGRPTLPGTPPQVSNRPPVPGPGADRPKGNDPRPTPPGLTPRNGDRSPGGVPPMPSQRPPRIPVPGGGAMPQPEPKGRQAPMPRPEQPRVRPAPMPQPQAPQARPEPPQQRRPEMPRMPMPQPRQAPPPQVRPTPQPSVPQPQAQPRPGGRGPGGDGPRRGGGEGRGRDR